MAVIAESYSNHLLYTPNADGLVPIQVLCTEGNLDGVKAQLDEDQSLIFRIDKMGRSLLQLAIGSGDIELVKYLVESNPNSLSYKDDQGNLPLHTVCQSGSEELQTFILDETKKCRPSINPKNLHFETPLMVAARKNDAKAVEILIKSGAKTDVQNFNDWTPFHSAAALQNHDMLTLLLEENSHGTHHKDVLGCTPLHYAAAKGDLVGMQLLIDYGAKINARNGECRTPMHEAARNNQVDAIRLLHANGASLNRHESDSGMVPLHVAVLHGHQEAAACLKELGARLTAKDRRGDTPAKWAEHAGNDELAELLKV